MDDDFLWKKALDEIALEVPGVTFDSVFKKTQLAVSKNECRVLCPNNGVCFVLKNKYFEVINQVLKKQLGHDSFNLLFVSRVTNGAPKNESPLFAKNTESLAEKLTRIGLREKFSFESFAVSSSNQIAYAAASAVAKDPGTVYNPLFVWGGVGVGKTHLLQAIGRRILEKQNKSVYYCSAEDFTNGLVEAIRSKNTAGFRKKLRGVDALLIDDIQFIRERDFVQEELFNTFNKLQSANKQIVFTSDRPPKLIGKIEDRLVSRFLSGLVVDVQPPDFELKTAILLIKAKERGVFLTTPQAKLVSANVDELRELEGVVNKLSSLKTAGVAVDEGLINKMVASPNGNKLNPKEIIQGVAKNLNVRLKDLREENRHKQVVFCRHLIMYFLKTSTKLTYEDIAKLLNKKDHTTVMHGVQKIIEQVGAESQTREVVEKIRQSLF